MPSWDKYFDHWTESQFIINGKLETSRCCCADPGGTSKTCRLWSGNKTNCRCHCHRLRRMEDEQQQKPKGR